MPPAGAAQCPRCRRPWRDHPYRTKAVAVRRTAAWQITIEDALSGRRETIEARALVNAAGLMTSHVPVIDQGTISSRAIVFRADMPADLTVLAKNNNGVFPLAAVYELVDGRAENKTVMAHGTRDMPIWGDRYRPGPDAAFYPYADLYVRTRILVVIDYLNSILAK
jgi:L-2-hydroxyglutarate oxidase LhgO